MALVLGCGDDSGGGSDGTSGSGGGESASGSATEGTGGTGSGLCFPAGLVDDFSAPDLDMSVWLLVDAFGIEPGVVDGRLTFSPTPGWTEGFWATLRPLADVDLSECTSWVEAARMLPVTAFGEVIYESQINADVYAMIRVNQPDIQFVLNTGGAEVLVSTITYDESAHRWWRYRDAAGVFYLETSADQSAWTTHIEHAHTWDMSSVRLSFKVNIATLAEEFVGPQFDNVNVTP